MLISVGAATTVLCTHVIILSLVTVFLKLRYHKYNLKQFLLNNSNSSSNYDFPVRRAKKIQENTAFSVFISVLLFTINPSSTCLAQTLPLLVLARCMYTLSFILRKQPYRFISATMIFFCNCYSAFKNIGHSWTFTE